MRTRYARKVNSKRIRRRRNKTCKRCNKTCNKTCRRCRRKTQKGGWGGMPIEQPKFEEKNKPV